MGAFSLVRNNVRCKGGIPLLLVRVFESTTQDSFDTSLGSIIW
jgi:hypothetical protein